MTIVEFGILGAPKNWANRYVNKFVLYGEKAEWLEASIILGRKARVAANVPVAEKDHPRRIIYVLEYRQRFLDKDGLYTSAKPIIDGLKTVLRRKIEKSFIQYVGAGLIFDDDAKHADWFVDQKKVGENGTAQEETRIRIEIPES